MSEARSPEANIQQYKSRISMCEMDLAELKKTRLKEKEEREKEIHKLKQELKDVKETRLKEKEDYRKGIRKLEQELADVNVARLIERQQHETEIEARDTYIKQLQLQLEALKKASGYRSG